MSKGKILYYEEQRGVGEIEGEDGRIYSLSRKGLSRELGGRLRSGMPVEFDPSEPHGSRKRPQALNVRLVGAHSARPPRPERQLPVRADSTPPGLFPPPYHFVPIPTKGDKVLAIADKPVFHDGSEVMARSLVSGELCCTLTALTPLFVGNYQYKLEELSIAGKAWLDAARSWGLPPDVVSEKTVLEPLRLDDGRVIIPGTSLKGMVRQSIGALLAAPMERVAERSYSYRPNLYGGRDGTLKALPAIVDYPPGNDGSNMKVTCVVPPGKTWGPWFPSGRYAERPFPPNRHRADVNPDRSEEHPYRGGLDGTGKLHDVHMDKQREEQANVRRFNTKHRALVPNHWTDRTQVLVDREVVLHYWATLDHLADKDHGHLSERHPLLESRTDPNRGKILHDIRELRAKGFQKGQLIYVEWDSSNNRVVSIGHNYHYRVRYADTVRTRWKSWGSYPNPGGKIEMVTRPVLEATKEERTRDDKGRPSKLTGARLMFGYCTDESDASGTKGIGKDDFQRLAGRVAFNAAIEHKDGAWDPSDDSAPGRFLNQDRDCVVMLKVLGTPRPSAVEYYLKQKRPASNRSGPGLLQTYGDIPGASPEGEELNGRKFYLHQPDVAEDPNCYTENSPKMLKSRQLAVARFVSDRGTQFRFTVRFKDLQLWELGALLLALDPGRIDTMPDRPRSLNDYLSRLDKHQDIRSRFALKLGHGRPIGLGSVIVHVDHYRIWNSGSLRDDPQIEARAMKAFWTKNRGVDESVLLRWLKVHQYRKRTHAAYPTRYDEKAKAEVIYAWHTDRRREHAKARRFPERAVPNPNVLPEL